MSGREGSVFSFEVDDWIDELLTRFKKQVHNHADKLGSQVEQYTLSTVAENLEAQDSEQRRAFKSRLRNDVSAVRIIEG
jgi:hypothetical protein